LEFDITIEITERETRLRCKRLTIDDQCGRTRLFPVDVGGTDRVASGVRQLSFGDDEQVATGVADYSNTIAIRFFDLNLIFEPTRETRIYYLNEW